MGVWVTSYLHVTQVVMRKKLQTNGLLRLDQVAAVGALQISWTGSESGEVEVSDEFDIPVVLEDSEGENV